MSTLFWKILRLSPVLLGASLFFCGSAYAQENASEQTVGNSTEVTVAPSTELPQTLVIASRTIAPQNISEPTVASGTDQAALPESTVEVSTQLPEITQTQPSISPVTPTDPSVNFNRADSTLAQQVPASDKTTAESAEVLQQIQQYQENDAGSPAEALDQVTNVTQLSDVRPTDWAYEALRSLVERYGCIAGYPDGTFRGNRAMTRYEFAAGLNACLQQIERIIGGGGNEFATKADLETLQRLVDEFRTELTALGGRVDQLEGRVAFLEDHQFSTTTKLRGEAIFAISDLFGGQDRAGNDYARDETVFQDRVRLSFDTSFTGKDLLRTRLQAGNFNDFGPLTSSPGPGVGITREGRLGFAADTGNSVEIDRLFYRFPLGNFGQAYLLASGVPFEDIVDVVNPGLDSSGTGALSRFGRFSPIYRMGGQGTGAAITLGGGKRPLRFDAVYSTNEGSNPDEGAGLFDGNYSALAQLTFKPFDAFKIAATYVNSYTGSGIGLNHSTGSLASNVRVNGSPVVGNSYGLEASFAFSPQLILSGWGAYTAARVIGVGDADVWTYGGTLSINDFGKKGSSLGFVVGMEPKLTGTSSAVLASGIGGLQAGRRSDRDTSLHLEGFYKFRLSPNILITPGVIWLTAPGHDSRNDDIFIGTLRTTFTF
ncbi:iron uptake porin [Allocoleopsis franciscana]|uniref:Putative S-layer protein n=1 Tax=Allocoleopsis franciscana PCC 7113 TaxID=1173027 RepID=K9WBV3_9CYAN|nr:iron uptake porin [Allocoleopsis franciscana]AFZ17291.1 putative S-layer protein [Allocoleopsis franciscana PCC 7113]